MQWIEAGLKAAMACHFGALVASGFCLHVVATVFGALGLTATLAVYVMHIDTE